MRTDGGGKILDQIDLVFGRHGVEQPVDKIGDGGFHVGESALYRALAVASGQGQRGGRLRQRDAAREQKAEQIGFSAYGVTRDMDDPVSKALHGLLDHSVETDRRLQAIISRLEAAGVKLDESMASGDDFDAGKLSKLVD